MMAIYMLQDYMAIMFQMEQVELLVHFTQVLQTLYQQQDLIMTETYTLMHFLTKIIMTFLI